MWICKIHIWIHIMYICWCYIGIWLYNTPLSTYGPNVLLHWKRISINTWMESFVFSRFCVCYSSHLGQRTNVFNSSKEIFHYSTCKMKKLLFMSWLILAIEAVNDWARFYYLLKRWPIYILYNSKHIHM